MTPATSTPHGGVLIDRAPTGAERESAIERADSLPSITIGSVAASDLELIGNGAFSPLTGFIGEADYRSVVDTMRLANGLPWSIPITLAVGRDEADALQIGSEVALRDEGGRLLGILELAEKYTYDAQHEAEQVFRTTEDAHPGVARIYAAGEVYLGGDVTVLNGPADPPFADVPPHAGRDARHLRREGLAPGGGLPDAQPHPSGPRVPDQGRAGGHRWPDDPSAGGRHQVGRHPGRRPDARLRDAAGATTTRPTGPC